MAQVSRTGEFVVIVGKFWSDKLAALNDVSTWWEFHHFISS